MGLKGCMKPTKWIAARAHGAVGGGASPTGGYRQSNWQVKTVVVRYRQLITLRRGKVFAAAPIIVLRWEEESNGGEKRRDESHKATQG